MLNPQSIIPMMAVNPNVIYIPDIDPLTGMQYDNGDLMTYGDGDIMTYGV